MKPLSLQDQMFLVLERRNQPMHVAGLQLLRPPADAGPDFMPEIGEFLRTHVSAQPPFNMRLQRRLGSWFWVEDTEFDLEAHFRHLSLPKPGRIRELLALVSQLHSAHLDRSKPLWEFYLIDGIEDGRIAIYSKIHHALVDGMAAMRMLVRSMTENPKERRTVPLWAMPPRKRDADAPREKGLAAGVAEAIALLSAQAKTLPAVTRELYRSIRESRSNPDYVSVFQAPKSALNQRITASRRFAAQSWSLDRIRAAGKAHGATVNDVVLAMCASALRSYLAELNALPAKPLTAMVPMSLRRDDSDAGNQVAMILANLQTTMADPVARLAAIKRSVENSKQRFASMNQAEILNYMSAIMAPFALNYATGAVPRWQAFNVIISNVPGPKKTLYWNGARLEGSYPVSIPNDGQALNITLNSYVDKLEFGLIACRRTLPHMQRLLDYLEQGLVELEGSKPLIS